MESDSCLSLSWGPLQTSQAPSTKDFMIWAAKAKNGRQDPFSSAFGHRSLWRCSGGRRKVLAWPGSCSPAEPAWPIPCGCVWVRSALPSCCPLGSPGQCCFLGSLPHAGRMRTFSLSTKEWWPVPDWLLLSSADWEAHWETQLDCGMQLLGLLLLLLGDLCEATSSGAPKETKGGFCLALCQFSLQEWKGKSQRASIWVLPTLKRNPGANPLHDPISR